MLISALIPFSSTNSTSAVMKKFTTVVRNDANAAPNVHATPSEMSPGPPVKISDSSECAADDDADRHVHHVAAQGELLKLFDELFHGETPLLQI